LINVQFGLQKGYVIEIINLTNGNFSKTKQIEKRIFRIEKCLDHILYGKEQIDILDVEKLLYEL